MFLFQGVVALSQLLLQGVHKSFEMLRFATFDWDEMEKETWFTRCQIFLPLACICGIDQQITKDHLVGFVSGFGCPGPSVPVDSMTRAQDKRLVRRT